MNTWIKHYNHNHDPRNGQFTYSSSGAASSKSVKKYLTADKDLNKIQESMKKEIENVRNTAKTDEEKDLRLKEIDEKYKKYESQVHKAVKNAKSDSKTVNLYKDAGLSQKDAEAAALRKKKIAIILGVTAGVALTAVAGYAIYKHYNNPLVHDITLRKGLKMQTLSEFADRTSNGDPFFASITKRDNATYITRFGKTDDKYGIGNNKNKIINVLNRPSKIASVKNSQKIFDELYSSDEKFKRLVDFQISKGGSKHGIEFLKSMSNEDKYLSFTKNIVYRNIDAKGNSVIGSQYIKFFNALKEKGYGGIIDTNDVKGVKASRELLGLGKAELQAKGFGTQRPIIFFDISAISNKSINKLSDIDFTKAGTVESMYRKFDNIEEVSKEYGKITLSQLAPLIMLSPIIYSKTYDSKVTGKTPEELRDIKKKRSNKNDLRRRYS